MDPSAASSSEKTCWKYLPSGMKNIIARASTREMAKLAVNQGMHTLRMVALDRARDGISTLEQVMLGTSAY